MGGDDRANASEDEAEPDNERFKLFFAGDQSEAQLWEYYMTPQKAKAALETGLGRSVAHTPRSLDVLQIVQLTGANPE